MTRRLTVGSTFTGVGGADLGFAHAGFDIAWQCELDEWKRSVQSAHYHDIPIYEDIQLLTNPEAVDVMIGGFPCQDLSVAGKRKGFDGSRSVLAFEFLRLAESLAPRWIVLENVPGLLSSNRGRDFARLLDEMVGCGYGVAWRILDARFFGVPQRRRRVFIVARRADAQFDTAGASRLALRALLEGGSGDIAPSWSAWQDATTSPGRGTPDGRVGVNGDAGESIVGTLTKMYAEQSGQDFSGGAGVISFYPNGRSMNGFARTDGVSQTLTRGSSVGAESGTAIAFRKSRRAASDADDETWVSDEGANTLNAFDVGDTRTTHAIVEVANALDCQRGEPDDNSAQAGHLVAYPIDDGRPVEKHQNGTGIGDADAPAYTLDRQQAASVVTVSPTLTKHNLDSRSPQSEEQQRIVGAVYEQTMSVRRLTPVECERLMGWPDDWTAPPGVKAPDSRRYAACGDGIVAPVAYWLALRIQMIENEETNA